MLQLAIDPNRYGQLQEFLQEDVLGRTAGDDFHTGYRWWRGVSGHGQLGDPDEQAVFSTVGESINHLNNQWRYTLERLDLEDQLL
jgi:hypothetical protein